MPDETELNSPYNDILESHELEKDCPPILAAQEIVVEVDDGEEEENTPIIIDGS